MLWTKLSDGIKNSPSLISFKKAVRKIDREFAGKQHISIIYNILILFILNFFIYGVTD